MAERARRAAVIGIGNMDRGDDGIGRLVVRRLGGRLPPEIAVVEMNGEPAELLTQLASLSTAWIVDACQSGAPPGTLHRFDAAANPIPAHSFTLSSHGLGLGEALELGRALKQLPAECTVYAVEGQCFDHGEPLSPDVECALEGMVEAILGEITTLTDVL